jgi:hypothetical protein
MSIQLLLKYCRIRPQRVGLLYGSKVIFKIWNKTNIYILKSEGLPVVLARIWKGYKTGASNRCWRNTCSSSKWKNGFVVAQKEELFYAALVS